jgi:hypothetical protein
MIIRDKFSREIRVLGPHDKMFEHDVAMKFYGVSEIVDFLHRTVARDFHNKARLREMLARLHGQVHALDDDQVLSELARHIFSGSVKIISRTDRAHIARASGGGGGSAKKVKKERKPLPPKVESPPPIFRKQLTWVEIELVDTAGKPVPDVRYRLELPDGEFQEGTLDQNGRARADDIDPGTCWITFPDHDKEVITRG